MRTKLAISLATAAISLGVMPAALKLLPIITVIIIKPAITDIMAVPISRK